MTPDRGARALAFALLVLAAGAAEVAGTATAESAADGEAPTALLEAPATEVTVGDPVTLRFVVSHPSGTLFERPVIGTETPEVAGAGEAGPGAPEPWVVDGIERIREDPVDPRRSVWEIIVRPFATGEVRVPPVTVRWRAPGSGEEGNVASGPATIAVQSVLEGEDTTPADIRGPWSIPRGLGWLLVYLIAAILLAAIGVWIARRLRRRRGDVTGRAAPAVPADPPWLRALRALDALVAEGLPARGKVKEFHIRIAEIVKRYLGEQHGFDALDRTTEEILADLAIRHVDPALAERARGFLDPCDLVKFAKHHPAGEEIDVTVRLARALIVSGRPAAPADREAAA